jgi:ABC-type transport system involved in Fe-S cluster assembly fused permease/ATPase subunit
MIIKSQRLRAVGIVAGMLAVCTTILVALRLVFTYLTAEMMPYVAGGLALTIILYLLYTIALAQVRYEDRIKEITRK